MNQHVLTADIEQAVETELRITAKPDFAALADFHRAGIAKSKQAIALFKRDMKASKERAASDRKTAKAVYDAEIARIADMEADDKAFVEQSIADETDLIGYHQAALGAIPE